MVTFHINIYCPKVYHGPDHFICVAEQHVKNILNPASSLRLELWAVLGFRQ
jgi:hypothetical protein